MVKQNLKVVMQVLFLFGMACAALAQIGSQCSHDPYNPCGDSLALGGTLDAGSGGCAGAPVNCAANRYHEQSE